MNSTTYDTGWKYFNHDQGETADDAKPLKIYNWEFCDNAEEAAVLASEYDWASNSGDEMTFGPGPTLVLIDKHGDEHVFETYRAVAVDHTVSEISEPDKD